MSWPIGPATSNRPGKPREAAAEQQAEPDHPVRDEAGIARRRRRLADDRDLEADQRARHQHPGRDARRAAPARRRDAAACPPGSSAAALDVGEQARLREAEALRVLPRARRPDAEDQRRDIGQHQAGQDLVDLEAGLAGRPGSPPRPCRRGCPPGTSAGRIQSAAHSPQNASATPPPAMAPMVNWPSAPMFQTLARKPIARPTRDHDQRRRLHAELGQAVEAR